MKKHKLKNFTKGWFLGDFTPTLNATSQFEVSIKSYKKGESESAHYHKIATEYTIIISGKVIMYNSIFRKGDIIEIEPGDITAFSALTNTNTVVVKIPSVKNDKYII